MGADDDGFQVAGRRPAAQRRSRRHGDFRHTPNQGRQVSDCLDLADCRSPQARNAGQGDERRHADACGAIGSKEMMAKLIRWSIANRFLVLLATLMMTAWGIWALSRTPLD